MSNEIIEHRARCAFFSLYPLRMMRRSTFVVIVIGFLLMAVVLLAAAWHSAFIRAQYLSMALDSTTRQTAMIANAMTLYYAEHDQWPEPGLDYDNSMFPFVSSRTFGRERIDTYDAFVTDYQVEFTLKPDGKIEAWVIERDR